jgi:hypothetical protein
VYNIQYPADGERLAFGAGQGVVVLYEERMNELWCDSSHHSITPAHVADP